MSNQGNIRVISAVEGVGSHTFTTGRWSGRMTPMVAQEALRAAIEMMGPGGTTYQDRIEYEAIGEICKHDSMAHLIYRLGNCDTPTVQINFSLKTVSWLKEWDPQKRECVEVWSFEEYLALDLEKLPLFQELYE